ncbi:MAG TPA: NrfD/PsrC family molybdoenzyme membrane anchor subunit [Longimicrobiales bacterium]|nr:NrfD/PsrC family molybdoenzyme membrane anchor subunit [Longimicrobiales bacterium]
MPDTYFTAAPDWTWWIVPYFFIGGIAGGAYFISALLVWFGRPEDRPVVRAGFYIATIGAIIGGILLILDLGRPERFWHMLFQNQEFPALAFKGYAPISFGAWGLMGFGAIATLSALGVLAEQRRFGLRPIPGLGSGPLWKALVAIGGLFGFFVAGYTGVLLTVTNRPVWADSQFLGMLFIASAASTAAATLIVLGRRRFHEGTVEWLSRFDAHVMVFELLVLVLFLATLGGAFEAWLGWWGVVLLLGVVVLGILVPLALHWRPGLLRGRAGEGRFSRWLRDPKLAAAVLVLVGGFLLRLAVIMASHGIEHARVVREGLP